MFLSCFLLPPRRFFFFLKNMIKNVGWILSWLFPFFLCQCSTFELFLLLCSLSVFFHFAPANALDCKSSFFYFKKIKDFSVFFPLTALEESQLFYYSFFLFVFCQLRHSIELFLSSWKRISYLNSFHKKIQYSFTLLSFY